MLTTTSVLRRTAATLSAVGALTALGLVPAAAHDEVLSTSPEQGAVLESAPEQIELSYSGEIMDIGHQVLVTGPEGQSVTEGPTDGSDSSAKAQDAAAQEDSGGLSGWAVGATVVVLALAVIGLLGLMSRRRRKS